MAPSLQTAPTSFPSAQEMRRSDWLTNIGSALKDADTDTGDADFENVGDKGTVQAKPAVPLDVGGNSSTKADREVEAAPVVESTPSFTLDNSSTGTTTEIVSGDDPEEVQRILVAVQIWTQSESSNAKNPASVGVGKGNESSTALKENSPEANGITDTTADTHKGEDSTAAAPEPTASEDDPEEVQRVLVALQICQAQLTSGGNPAPVGDEKNSTSSSAPIEESSEPGADSPADAANPPLEIDTAAPSPPSTIASTPGPYTPQEEHYRPLKRNSDSVDVGNHYPETVKRARGYPEENPGHNRIYQPIPERPPVQPVAQDNAYPPVLAPQMGPAPCHHPPIGYQPPPMALALPQANHSIPSRNHNSPNVEFYGPTLPTAQRKASASTSRPNVMHHRSVSTPNQWAPYPRYEASIDHGYPPHVHSIHQAPQYPVYPPHSNHIATILAIPTALPDSALALNPLPQPAPPRAASAPPVMVADIPVASRSYEQAPFERRRPKGQGKKRTASNSRVRARQAQAVASGSGSSLTAIPETQETQEQGQDGGSGESSEFPQRKE